MSATHRPCEKCGKNRALRFFPVDARRKDGLSTRCTTCRRSRRALGDRNQRLTQTYGITEDEYKAILAHQGGVCAICGGARKVNMDLDHSHASGLVRGICCRRCNRRLLPAALDNVDVLQRAIAYLQDPPAPHALGREVYVPPR